MAWRGREVLRYDRSIKMVLMSRRGVVVFSRPSIDPTKAYLFGRWWLWRCVGESTLRALDVVDLEGDLATRVDLRLALDEKDPAFFVAYGHGSPTQMAGQYDALGRPNIMLDLGNAGWMHERIIYLLSCSCGKELGPKIIELGGEAYIGYNEDFYWIVRDPNRPGGDPYARGFGSAVVAVVLTLLRGGTVQMAYERSIETFNKYIEYWRQSEDPYAREAVKFLLWDRDCTIALGNVQATIVEPRPLVALIRAALLGLFTLFGHKV